MKRFVHSSRFALLALSLTLAAMVAMLAPSAADAATRPPKLYINIVVTETTTTVGQQPKIVVTYGNTGGTTIDSFEGECHDTRDKLDFTDLNFVYHQLIPGQNDNVTFTTFAREAGTTYVKCSLAGFYHDKYGNHTLFVTSNTVKVVIKRQ